MEFASARRVVRVWIWTFQVTREFGFGSQPLEEERMVRLSGSRQTSSRPSFVGSTQRARKWPMGGLPTRWRSTERFGYATWTATSWSLPQIRNHLKFIAWRPEFVRKLARDQHGAKPPVPPTGRGAMMSDHEFSRTQHRAIGGILSHGSIVRTLFPFDVVLDHAAVIASSCFTGSRTRRTRLRTSPSRTT